MNKIKIKKGSNVFLSQKGHRGFIYTGEKSITVLYDVLCESPPWVGSQDKKAVLLPENSVLISGSPSSLIAEWIKNES